MYLRHFQLGEKPFEITTDSRFLWLGEKHQEAFATLRYGILDNKGFLLLTGDEGTGKTTDTAEAPVAGDKQAPAPPSPPAPADLQLAAASSGEIPRGDTTEPLLPEQTKAPPTPVPETASEKEEKEKKNRIVVRALTEEEIVSFMELHPARENTNPTADTPSLRMPIQFERNSGELTEEARKIIDQVICPALKNDKLAGAVYELSGHTDDRGDFDTNMYLSRIRVYTVRDYLVAGCGWSTSAPPGPWSPTPVRQTGGRSKPSELSPVHILLVRLLSPG